MRRCSHRRSPSPPGGHAMVSSVAAYCVRPTAHALLCTVNGDDTAVFLSLVTLTFDIRTWLRFLYNAPRLTAKFHHPVFNRSEGIMRTNKQTNKCVSRQARRKSHHTALSNAAAPNSECPCHAPTHRIRRRFIPEVMPPTP